jgi:hypothetical protein
VIGRRKPILSLQTRSSTPGIPDDWWPDFIPPLDDNSFIQDQHITVAEIVEPGGEGSYRQVFTALAPPPVAEQVLASPGSIGFEVSATGPHPSVSAGSEPLGYEPRFFIFGGEAAPDGLEPLVVSWTSANVTLLRLDQGFLMTYALLPRVIGSGRGEIEEHWDDSETPQTDIVVSVPRSVYEIPQASPAWIRVRKEYIRDYAFLRDRCLLHVVYGHGEGIVSGDTLRALEAARHAEILRPGTKLTVVLKNPTGLVHVRYWAVRLLAEPHGSPISAERWDYGALEWPGIAGPVTDRRGFHPMEFVYVRDEVLEEYEGRANEGFRVGPETGAVSYAGQWAVGHIDRIGRDLLQLEIRKK